MLVKYKRHTKISEETSAREKSTTTASWVVNHDEDRNKKKVETEK